MPTTFTPPYTQPEHALAHLQERGYVVLAPKGLTSWLNLEAPLGGWVEQWSDLPPDDHLRDEGAYRFRRHSSFLVHGQKLELVPHRAHWQPLDYNALHGGMRRWFEPFEERFLADPSWQSFLVSLTDKVSRLHGFEGPWHVEAHAFRITTGSGIGRPTPEGAHRDGVDQVAVVLIDRSEVKGGETRVFEAHGPNGQRFTMTDPGTALLIDDARAIHETTPIQPLEREGVGHRDTLVLTWRRGGFLEP